MAFADGNKVFALYVRLLPLSTKITLGQVLYVPYLNSTMVSVKTLLKQTNWLASFTDTIGVLRDHFSTTQIGTSEQCDGMYYFTDIVSARSHRAVCSLDQTLWHRRLGHPYYEYIWIFFFFLMFLNQLTLVRVIFVLELGKLVKAFMIV